jgi:histone H3/H4
VGKVAKAAPVLISKCLELLIGDLIKSASKICKSKNAATVNVNHLREAVAKENTFDFLQEVISS